MKKVLFLLIAFFTIGYGQGYHWGSGEYSWGNTFKDADSLYLSRTVTTLDSMDTLYTNALDKTYDFEDGVYHVKFYADSVDAPFDSLFLDVRLGTKFGDFRSPTIKWEPWYNIIGVMATDTLYTLTISPTDSSWYVPANFLQYRLYPVDEDASTAPDTLSPHLTDFRH